MNIFFEHWFITLAVVPIVLFLCYIVPRLIFSALFRSYWEAKKEFHKSEEEKNEKPT